jgi:hypothetical protein
VSTDRELRRHDPQAGCAAGSTVPAPLVASGWRCEAARIKEESPMNKFKIEDRVVFKAFGNLQAGRVVKVAKTTATLILDDGREDRLRLEQLRLETPEDVDQRAHATNMREWNARRPRTTTACVQASGYRSDTLSANVISARTPEEMRIAARELMEIADWFESRPVAP